MKLVIIFTFTLILKFSECLLLFWVIALVTFIITAEVHVMVYFLEVFVYIFC